jgi:hypothetical protein
LAAQPEVHNAGKLAATAIETADRQHMILPGQALTASMVASLAKEVIALNEQISDVDNSSRAGFTSANSPR